MISGLPRIGASPRPWCSVQSWRCSPASSCSFSAGHHRRAEATESPAMEAPRTPRWALLVILVLMGFGGVLRVAHLSDISFDVDEISVITGAKGILVNGYPHVHLGSFTKRATTYEMTMYPLAAAGWLFGYSEAASRLPSVICATLTIRLIGWVGCRIFDWRGSADLRADLHLPCDVPLLEPERFLAIPGPDDDPAHLLVLL